MSGKYVVLFDPQGAYLPNVSAANPGKRIEYVSSSAITMYHDQLSPYCAFGCDMKASFQGTLFRFPLRSYEQAFSSRLSRQSYTEDDILSLFAQLYQEAVYNLLFLKNVLSLEMYVWEAGMSDPKIIYSCYLGPQSEKLSWHRQALVRFSGTPAESSKEKLDSFSMDFISEAFLGNKIDKKSATYFIVQGMASVSSKIGIFATAAAKEYDLHLLPWASVAACISNTGLEVIPDSFSIFVSSTDLGCLGPTLSCNLDPEHFFPSECKLRKALEFSLECQLNYSRSSYFLVAWLYTFFQFVFCYQFMNIEANYSCM